jgi:hypothetical protein
MQRGYRMALTGATITRGHRTRGAGRGSVPLRGAIYGDLVGYRKPKMRAQNGVAVAVPVVLVKLDKIKRKTPLAFWVDDIEVLS